MTEQEIERRVRILTLQRQASRERREARLKRDYAERLIRQAIELESSADQSESVAKDLEARA